MTAASLLARLAHSAERPAPERPAPGRPASPAALRSASLRALLDDTAWHLAQGRALPATAVPSGFADLDDLLRTLHGTWLRVLQARLEQAWELGGLDAEADAVAAWTEAARAVPAVRALLDQHAGQPVLEGLRGAEARWVALTTGVDLRRAGRLLERAAA